MQSCKKCHHCKLSYDCQLKTYKCDITPGKTFNIPDVHGMVCKGYEEDKDKEVIYHGIYR